MNNRPLILTWRHIREFFKTLGKILRRIEMQYIGNLRKVMIPLPDQSLGLLDLQGIAIFHNAAGLIQGKQIFYCALTFSHISGNNGNIQFVI